MLLGYNTNGFAHHRLEDALEILAELGYQAVAITPDVHHLPPFETSAGQLRTIRRRLEELGLGVVIETGARYVLDPRRKHRPNLLDAEEPARTRRLEFLFRCAEMAAELGGQVVSIWAGARPAETDPADPWGLLVRGVEALCRRADAVGVQVAFEPEPGMLVETLAEWERLRSEVAHPALGLALDVGHVPCTEQIFPAEAICRYAGEILTVHLDDVRGRVHEHLQIGEGDLDWAEIAGALQGSQFQGIASFELSRHSHAAPQAAKDALTRFSAHLPTGGPRT